MVEHEHDDSAPATMVPGAFVTITEPEQTGGALVDVSAMSESAQLRIMAMQAGPEGPAMLRALFEIERDARSDEAARECAVALSAAQAAAPEVTKDSWNDQTKSYYAKLSSVAKALRPVYTAHGLSLVFGEGEAKREGDIRVTCDVMHVGGHVMHRYIDLPPDDRGIAGKVNKTPIHGKASTISYGQRYLTSMILAPDMIDRDKDGNLDREPEPVEPVTREQADELRQLVQGLYPDPGAFLAKYGSDTFAIAATHYQHALDRIDRRRKWLDEPEHAEQKARNDAEIAEAERRRTPQ